MSMERSIVDELRAADQLARRQGPPPEVDARLRRAFRQVGRAPEPPPPRRSWWPAAVTVAVAAAVVLFAISSDPGGSSATATRPAPPGATPGEASPDEGSSASKVASFVKEPACHTSTPVGSVRLGAPCLWRLEDLGVRVSSAAGAEVRREGDVLVVTAGLVTFDVDKRGPTDKPFRVRAGEATIEVLGTRFVVALEPAPGWVRLVHGSIRLLRPGVEPKLMVPGDKELLAVVATAHTNDAPRPAATTPSSVVAEASPLLGGDAEEAVEQIAHKTIEARLQKMPGASPGEERAGAPSAMVLPPPTTRPVTVVGAQALLEVARLRALGDYPEALERLDELLLEPRLAERSRQVALYERVSLLRRTEASDQERCQALKDFLDVAPEDLRAERARRERTALGCP